MRVNKPIIYIIPYVKKISKYYVKKISNFYKSSAYPASTYIYAVLILYIY